jgi:hypothetical protein
MAKTNPNQKPKGAFAQGFAKGYDTMGNILDPDALRKGLTALGKKITTPDDETTKMKVTAADKRMNTVAYQRLMKGDPRYVNAIKEGLADKADMAERDHEVQMARADLYKIAKYAIELHDMMKKVTEAEGIEGWQQAKITKAADYMSSVFHSLDYDLRFNEVTEAKDTHCSDKCCGADVKREDCVCPADCEHCNCNNSKVAEGKSPHKKGTKKYKAHMAAMHAESIKDPYKKGLMDKLHEAKQSVCKECGNPSYTTLDEEKQKGVDGKVCWKGYKRMGTKKKGGKTVDNCVKM